MMAMLLDRSPPGARLMDHSSVPAQGGEPAPVWLNPRRSKSIWEMDINALLNIYSQC